MATFVFAISALLAFEVIVAAVELGTGSISKRTPCTVALGLVLNVSLLIGAACLLVRG